LLHWQHQDHEGRQAEETDSRYSQGKMKIALTVAVASSAFDHPPLFKPANGKKALVLSAVAREVIFVFKEVWLMAS
jgi:hypothetical protein